MSCDSDMADFGLVLLSALGGFTLFQVPIILRVMGATDPKVTRAVQRISQEVLM